MNRLNKTKSDVFLYCRFSVFLRICFLDYLEVATAVIVELVILHSVYRYSVDSFSCSGPSGYWVLMESRIPLKPMLGGVRIMALSISSREQNKTVCCLLVL